MPHIEAVEFDNKKLSAHEVKLLIVDDEPFNLVALEGLLNFLSID